MSTTQTYLVAATIAAAGAGGYYITGQLTEADAPAPVVAQATPAPAAPDPEPFDAVDAMLNPFREIDAITRPAPPALPPPPLPVEDIRTALYQGATDARLAESIIAAFLERVHLHQTEEVATLTPIPLIPPAMPDITIIREATRLTAASPTNSATTPPSPPSSRTSSPATPAHSASPPRRPTTPCHSPSPTLPTARSPSCPSFPT